MRRDAERASLGATASDAVVAMTAESERCEQQRDESYRAEYSQGTAAFSAHRRTVYARPLRLSRRFSSI